MSRLSSSGPHRMAQPDMRSKGITHVLYLMLKVICYVTIEMYMYVYLFTCVCLC